MASKKPTTATVDLKGEGDTKITMTAPKGYRIGRRVTTPLVSLTYNNDFAFEVEGEMVTQASAKAAKEGGQPMTVMPVINLETGESVTLIVPTVLESALQRTPGGYLGKKFLAKQGPKPAGKRYFAIELVELEDG